MSNCKLRTLLEDGTLHTMSCETVREKYHELKKEFRKKNRTDEIMKHGREDRMYKQYCESLDNFLNKCKCIDKIALKCEKCSEEDHEGYFCKCEMRNIALAKQLRKEGNGNWNENRNANAP